MPISTLKNNIFKITDLSVGFDSAGCYVHMSAGHCDAVVLCVSQRDPITQQDLQLTDSDLQSLFMGGKLDFPDQGYMLQGITRQQLAGAGQYRNFTLMPPAYVQVWGMTRGDSGTELWFPEDPATQQRLVPIEYNYYCEDDAFYVRILLPDGYQDGDLMYHVSGHLPIPIPSQYINQIIPLRPGTTVTVIPAPGAEEKYILKRDL